MTRTPAGWDVESPVQAEVFVVWLREPVVAAVKHGRRIHNMEPTGDEVLAMIVEDAPSGAGPPTAEAPATGS